MPISIEVIKDPARFGELAESWERLLVENPSSANGLDATNGYPWFYALTQTFAPARTARIVVLRENGQIVGLLPLVAIGGSLCKNLIVATELYGGRNGLILQRHDPDLLAALLQGIGIAYGRWRSLKMMIVEGSRSDQLLQAAGQDLGLKILSNPGWESPYFPLKQTHEEFQAGMSGSLKQTIRTSTNKIKSLGKLQYLDIAPPQNPDTLIEAILTIERASWKHAAGSAISCIPYQETFYRTFFSDALKLGQIFGTIMILDDTPIAFNFGLLRSGIYSCLKHSNRQDRQNISPSQLLNVVLIDKLRARGVTVYDYMGKAEPHKLRWSNDNGIYYRHPTWIFGNSPCGIIGHKIQSLKQFIKQRGSSIVNQPANATPGQEQDSK